MTAMIRKASKTEIINHWLLAGSCIVLIVTGYGFVFRVESLYALFGTNEAMKLVHNWSGVLFTVSMSVTMIHYLEESLDFTRDDWEWIKIGGGYLSRKSVKVPPMGKLNTGQKIYYLAHLMAGIALAATGFIIWLFPSGRTLIMISHLVHNLGFVFFVVAIPVHAYLGTLANPGTLRIMIYGTVPVEFAKKKYPKWMKETGKA